MHNNNFEEMFSKIQPDSALKDRIIKKMEAEEMKKSTKRNITGMIAAAACVAVVGASTVFAAGNIISYFQSDKAVELTNIDALSQYNSEVGVSTSNFGYTLTLDNIATDDNFMHVFYTLKKDDGTTMTPTDFWFICRINGEVANFGNHNEEDAYLAEDGSYKGILKLNVANMNIPDKFTLEMYSYDGKETSPFEGGYLTQDNLTLTPEDKTKLLYVSTTASKASVKAKSVIKEPNVQFPITYYNEINEKKSGIAEISKVIFSPFANQIIVTDKCEGCGGMQLSMWALFDENGQSLDILNTDLCGGKEGVETSNALEFLKADASTKKLTFVPAKENNFIEQVSQPIGSYPLIYEANQYGKIVVTDIRFYDAAIEIDYYKDGYSLFDPYMEMYDADGNVFQPSGKLGCTLYTRVHHNTNSYTARYEYYNDFDPNSGEEIITDPNSLNKDALQNGFKNLGIGKYNVELDYDKAIEIDLGK